jgi:hypothetical protein
MHRAPVRRCANPVHLDPKIQEHLRVEEALEVLPRFGADSLDHLSAAPNHDGLL